MSIRVLIGVSVFVASMVYCNSSPGMCVCVGVGFLKFSVPTAGCCSSQIMISFKLITIRGTAHCDQEPHIAALRTLGTILDEQLTIAI